MIRLSLRAKSALGLGICILMVLALALLSGWQALQTVQENLGSAYARNVTRYNKQRILTPVLRELALSQRLADSDITRRFLLDENNSQKKELFFAEAEGYRHAFQDHSYFVISAQTRAYYFNDDRTAHSRRPRYFLKASDPNDKWFFSTMQDNKPFNVNVDPDVKLHVTKVWFNVVVKDKNHNIGLAGTGLDLTTFLNRFITNDEAGVTPMIVNRDGAIQAHPDRKLIDYASVNEKGDQHNTIYRLLPSKSDQAAMRSALQQAEAAPEKVQMLWGQLDGRRQLFALSFIPELNWGVLTAVDLKAAQVFDQSLLGPAMLLGVLLLLFLMLALMVAVDRILLRPLLRLTDSARAVTAGNYDIALPPAGKDELGELTNAFGVMATQVQTHTAELESKVQQRTQELSTINEQMRAANKKIGDSIEYASLIQNSILANQELSRTLDGDYFVLWQPCDSVGGDFYVFRAGESGCLLGVVDCAGHSVAGALMTMIAHSTFNVTMDALNLADPAQILMQVNQRLRSQLRTSSEHSHVATNMDAGLVYLDYQSQTLTYSGAKISLYWSDGQASGELKGARHAIGGKHTPSFTNHILPFRAGMNCYLTTDGFLDQAGGAQGFSFGNSRFVELLLSQANRPFAEQQQALAQALSQYQGTLPQRDDITVVGFGFDHFIRNYSQAAQAQATQTQATQAQVAQEGNQHGS